MVISWTATCTSTIEPRLIGCDSKAEPRQSGNECAWAVRAALCTTACSPSDSPGNTLFGVSKVKPTGSWTGFQKSTDSFRICQNEGCATEGGGGGGGGAGGMTRDGGGGACSRGRDGGGVSSTGGVGGGAGRC